MGSEIVPAEPKKEEDDGYVPPRDDMTWPMMKDVIASVRERGAATARELVARIAARAPAPADVVLWPREHNHVPAQARVARELSRRG